MSFRLDLPGGHSWKGYGEDIVNTFLRKVESGRNMKSGIQDIKCNARFCV